MLIPFGFFGSLLFLVAVEAVVAAGFVFVWPGVHARLFAILGCAFFLGAIASVALWLWYLSPLNGIGIAGGSPSDGQSPDVVVAYMQKRYAIVVVAAAFAQSGAMAVLRFWLGIARA